MTAAESYLEERKILPTTIAAHHLEFEATPAAERIIERLGGDILVEKQPLSKYAKELLWVPYLNSDGVITSWTARIFPTPADGPKFLTPKDGGGPPYIPPAVWEVVSKADAPIILTEGPIKALACLQAGHIAIGLNGVFGVGSRDVSDKINLHPLMAGFVWTKRSVYLAFDADLTVKFEVRRALLRTCLLLAAEGAGVHLITSWDESDGKGIDDFLAKAGNPAEQLGLLVKDRAPVFSILDKTPADLKLVVQELQAVTLSRLQRSQIVRQLAKAVGVPAKELLDATLPPEEKADNDREVRLVDETAPWDGPVDGTELFRETYSLLGQVMWMNDSARLTVTFWLIASYTFKLYRKFPYLRIKSADKNCGKSTLIDFVAELVFNPLIASDVSPAALYRVVEKFTPTLLLDEFDNKEQVRELTQLLNAGYDNNRSALRYNMDKDCAERFRTYCPKVIASIKRITDTTESRCLPIDLQRVTAEAENKLVELCDINPAVFLTIKRKIIAWVEDNLPEIKACRLVRPAWLHTRDWDMWRPCYVIGAVLGERGNELVNQAATGVSGDRVVEQSLAIEILACIRKAIRLPSLIIEAQKAKKAGPFIRTQALVDHCNGYEERPWADWKTGDKVGLTTARFAKELREHFKLKSEQVWHEKKYVYGYWVEPFQKLFDSFLPPEDDEQPPTDPTEPPDEGEKKEASSPGGKHPPDGNVSNESPSGLGTSSRCHPKLDSNNVAVQNRTTTYAISTTPEAYPPYVAVQEVFSTGGENVALAIDVETAAAEAESGFADNKMLFGFDPTERIVAVEFAPPNIAVVFIRQPDGTTKATREPFCAFTWQENESGLLTARYFPDWRSLPRGKGAGGHDLVLRDSAHQYLLGSGRTLFKGMRFEDLRRMQVDIETDCAEGYDMSNPERDQLIAIAVADSSGWEELVVIEEGSPESESRAIERLCQLVSERDPDVIEGHNFFKFDLPFLAERACRLGARLAFGRYGSVLKRGARPGCFSVGGQRVEFPAFRVFGRHIVDTYLLARAYDVAGRQLESYGLKAVAAALGVQEPGRIILEGRDIMRAYREDREKFCRYARQDVRETRAVSGILSRSYFVQAQIFPYNYQDVIIRGTATKVNSLFLREYLRRSVDIPVPPQKREFKGALCKVHATGVIKNVWHCDVASLYPSAMLAFGYLPKSDHLGIFGAMLRDLRAFRLEAKRQAKAATNLVERKRLEALQATFKILINSAYGYLGFAHGHFADFEAAAAVTAKGRELLQEMVDWMRSRGARVVEIDTDGIYFSPPDGVDVQELTRKLAAELPEGIVLELGEHYPAMFSYRSKNAAFLKADGSMVVKGGALRSRGMEPYLGRYLQATLQLLFDGRPEEVGALYDGLVRQIELRELPITDFAESQTLHVPLEEYQAKVEAGKRNKEAAFELAIKSERAYVAGDQLSYYIAASGNGKSPLFERAKLISQWDPNRRDEDIAHYLRQLDERASRFDQWAPHHPQAHLL